ncbi:MAG: kelch repeat-containing protein [Bacteroidota bacterium]
MHPPAFPHALAVSPTVRPTDASSLGAAILGTTLALLLLSGCDFADDDDADQGDWTEVSSFEGVPRSNAVAFSIGEKGYLGTGFDGDDPLADLWEFDPVLNFWTQRASLPAPPRSAAVGFAVNGRGYVGTGFNDDIEDDVLADFWRYDPAANTWTQVADFGGAARFGAVAFTLGGRGYVGTGNDDDNDLKDFWAYDPVADAWTQVVSLPGDKRLGASAFVLDGRAYVGTGRNNGVLEDDFWAYDPAANQWTRLADIDEDEDGDGIALPRLNAVGFAVGGRGYLATGERGELSSAVWQYDPLTDTWEEFSAYDGLPRFDAVAFVVNDVAYVGTGTTGSSRFDDVWAFDPTVENDDDDD